VGGNVGTTSRLTISTAATTAAASFGEVAGLVTFAAFFGVCKTLTRFVYSAAVAACAGRRMARARVVTAILLTLAVPVVIGRRLRETAATEAADDEGAPHSRMLSRADSAAPQILTALSKSSLSARISASLVRLSMHVKTDHLLQGILSLVRGFSCPEVHLSGSSLVRVFCMAPNIVACILLKAKKQFRQIDPTSLPLPFPSSAFILHSQSPEETQ
jgi:hypothetical protein